MSNLSGNLQGDDLLFTKLEAQAKQVTAQYYIYLSVVLFLLITVASITDKDLLINNSLVMLPFLNVSISPGGILWLGPIFFTFHFL